MDEQPKEIVAIRTREVRGHEHIERVKLHDGDEASVEQVIREIEDGLAVYVMKPPEGAPAYEAHQRTGLPLIVQVGPCPDCDQKIIWA